MATDFTQDTLLHFLQSSGGQVKNSDLILHFRNFIRDHADRNRNRELFKKFVNSVATVRQIDGVSYVVLRKKFNAHVGGGEGSSSEQPTGRNAELSPEKGKHSPAWSAEKPRQKLPQLREVTAPAPAGGTAGKTILPAAGIMLLNNNNMETNLNLKRKQVSSTPELPVRPAAAAQVVSQTPRLSEPPDPDQSTKVGQHRVVHPAVRPHGETRQQVPVPEARLQPAELQSLHQEPPLHHQVQGAPRSIRPHGETRQQVPVPEARLQPAELQSLHQEPPLHHQAQGAPRRIRPHGETSQQVPVPEPLRGREARLQSLHQEPPLHQKPPFHQEPHLHHASLQAQGAPRHIRPHGETSQQVPVPEPLRGREVRLQSLHQEPPLHHASLQAQGAPRHIRPHGETSQQVPVPEPLRGREVCLQSLHQEPPLHHASLQAQGAPRHIRPHGETSQQVPVPEPLRGREARLQPVELQSLHQEPPLHHRAQGAPRRIRHRPSYKSAVSYDEYEEEEEEVVQLRRGSAGGAWPLSTPLGDMGRAISASSPCIIDQPVVSSASSLCIVDQPVVSSTSSLCIVDQPVVSSASSLCIVDQPVVSSVSSSSSSSSEMKLPQIYVQDVEGKTLPPGGGPGWRSESGEGQRGQWAGPGMEPGSVPPGESTRRSLPLEAERYMPSNSRYEELQARAGRTGSGSQIQEVLGRAQRKKLESVTHQANSKTTTPWHHSTGSLHDDQEPSDRLSPLHHSNDHLHVDQSSTARVMPWHLSTGDIYDDREETESSDGSTSSPPLRTRPSVARRLSSQLRNRMCRSLGADLDQILQEEERAGGGSEAARLNRLHMISSSLSLRYNLSSSSLSSCSTPPRCRSSTDLNEGVEGRRSSPTTASSPAHHEGSSRQQSLVPLEPREHAWLVKGAAGAWPDIYTLFREDSSLLNRQDFISGFTVLHWIAKHGDHRVLNTLWYGVQKAGLTLDVNAKSTCGHTPLHIAAMHGNKNIMRLLVSKFDADVKLRDTAGKKPWQYLSRTWPPDVFELLGAPARLTGKGEEGVRREDPNLEQRQPHRRRRRHHLSFASSGDRPLTMTGTTRVKRSSSIAAFLKHKSMLPFLGHHSDSSF